MASTPKWWIRTLRNRPQKCPKTIEVGASASIYSRYGFLLFINAYIIDLTFCIEISKLEKKIPWNCQTLSKPYKIFWFSSWLEVLGLPYQRRWWFWFWSWLYISQCILSTGCGETLGFLSGQGFGLGFSGRKGEGMLSWPSQKLTENVLEHGPKKEGLSSNHPFSVPNCWG